MQSSQTFLDAIRFFQCVPQNFPGSLAYDTGFCHMLVQCTRADAASVWQMDDFQRLHLKASSDISCDQVQDITLSVGEGICGAAALSRAPLSVVNAQKLNIHDPRVDKRFGLHTYAMVSAPILFEDHLFGVVNILSHHADKHFEPAWSERLLALAVLYAAALAKEGNLRRYNIKLLKSDDAKEKTSSPEGSSSVIVGISRAVQDILHLCIKAGTTDIPVLIYGETGTGKELAARRIHESGSRASGPFIDVNCAALSETLLESELFGHVKGAFTGATRDRAGKFVAASGGTLFLDEIGEMSDACQAKILRALEEKKVTPVGSEKAVTSSVRIIAATNKDLKQMIADKKFREDLYYRLCGIEITVPPLRERIEDIYLLTLHCLNKAHTRQDSSLMLKKPPRLSPETLELIKSFSWPGNVRQLEQALYAAATLCESDEIKPTDLPNWLHKAIMPTPEMNALPKQQIDAMPAATKRLMPESSPHEADRFFSVLDATKYRGTGRWNISAAARELGIPRETLAYRLKKKTGLKKVHDEPD